MIQYSLDGGTTWANAVWTDTSGGANTSGTWSATLSGLVEGNHSVIVRANDAASNTTTLGAAAFGVDLNPPVLGVANVPATITAATGASFPGFSGTLYDTDPAGLASLVVTSTQNGSTVAFNTSITYPGTSTVSGNPWSYAFSVDTAGHSTDGLWSFVFTATDVSGKVTTVTKTITIDTLPPTTTVTSPSSGAWVSTTSLSVTGVASDGSGTGVSKVYVKADGLYVASGPTDHSAEDPTVLANGWTTATGQSNWSASLTLSGEGRKTLWIKAIDVAGNLTTAAGAISSRVDFGLDLNPPALGFTDSVSSLVNSAFTLAGTTTDTEPRRSPDPRRRSGRRGVPGRDRDWRSVELPGRGRHGRPYERRVAYLCLHRHRRGGEDYHPVAHDHHRLDAADDGHHSAGQLYERPAAVLAIRSDGLVCGLRGGSGLLGFRRREGLLQGRRPGDQPRIGQPRVPGLDARGGDRHLVGHGEPRHAGRRPVHALDGRLRQRRESLVDLVAELRRGPEPADADRDQSPRDLVLPRPRIRLREP